MRELTFPGFLARYVKELSQADTLNMKELAAEAEASNHRLRAPLVLYAAVFGKTALLAQSLGQSEGAVELRGILQEFSGGNVEQKLRAGLASKDCQKVWAAFLAAKGVPDRNRALKDAIRKKVLLLQADRGCSNYRIYTDLKLNPGNVNNWLKHGSSEKVSCQTAERIMNYVLSRPEQK